MSEDKRLLRSMFPEVFQSERSAIRHCRLEADRVGPETPPGKAMLAVSAHAREAERDLTRLGTARGIRTQGVGSFVGEVFSASRRFVADAMITLQTSYRGTLLGMRHGMDAMLFLGLVGRVESDDELSRWCDAWRDTRLPLVGEAERALSYFAEQQDAALRSPIRSRSPAR